MMKRLPLAFLVATLAGAMSTQALDTNDVNVMILQELQQIRASLAKISDEVAALRKESEDKKKISQMAGFDGMGSMSGPNIEKLAKIEWINSTDPEQIKKYIIDIILSSQGQRSWSDRDPQVAMLAKVGSANLPELINAMSMTDSMNNYHVLQAIEILASDKHKTLILENLPLHHELVKTISKKGWEEDARATLLTELKNKGQYLPTEWIAAVASLQDPESYPLLREYFISGHNPYWTYKAIKDLPIEDLEGAVLEAWERNKHDDCNGSYLAMIAMEYGRQDALEAVLSVLTAEEPHNSWTSREMRPKLLKCVDVRGSNDDILKWYEANKDTLRFDKETKKFVAGE
ncbi:MAG TPA: hypothetical protein DCZ95_02435 [Verrucomicrobia bacterium]|nr:MAG: hypothetical protein A2X46_00415 [Lentisphaerae bacterium GWF2_57_35]HBA82930.1 hypothetical protein [Verrucomicrobiota bacterium]